MLNWRSAVSSTVPVVHDLGAWPLPVPPHPPSARPDHSHRRPGRATVHARSEYTSAHLRLPKPSRILKLLLPQLPVLLAQLALPACQVQRIRGKASIFLTPSRSAPNRGHHRHNTNNHLHLPYPPHPRSSERETRTETVTDLQPRSIAERIALPPGRACGWITPPLPRPAPVASYLTSRSVDRVQLEVDQRPSATHRLGLRVRCSQVRVCRVISCATS
nr:hypothetical protein CFP56_34912 [Quercus suber]